MWIAWIRDSKSKCNKTTLGKKYTPVDLQRRDGCETREQCVVSKMMMYDGKNNTVQSLHKGDAESSTPHWYREQAANYGETYEHGDECTAHNNLPLRS